MVAPVQARVFARAAELLGGPQQLSARLGVPPAQVSRWMSNLETSPLPAFFDALDIVLADQDGFAAVFCRRSRSRRTVSTH